MSDEQRQRAARRLQAAIRQQREHLELNGDDDDVSEADCLDAIFDECGQQSDGSCLLAGTEHCDWDCPFSN